MKTPTINPWRPETERERLMKTKVAAHRLRMMTKQQSDLALSNFIVSVFSAARGVYEMGRILRQTQGSIESQQFIALMSDDIKKQMCEQLGIDFDALRQGQERSEDTKDRVGHGATAETR
jgi:hypothetical protein